MAERVTTFPTLDSLLGMDEDGVRAFVDRLSDDDRRTLLARLEDHVRRAVDAWACTEAEARAAGLDPRPARPTAPDARHSTSGSPTPGPPTSSFRHPHIEAGLPDVWTWRDGRPTFRVRTYRKLRLVARVRSSDGRQWYEVRRHVRDPRLVTCTCKGFRYRGRCRHVADVGRSA